MNLNHVNLHPICFAISQYVSDLWHVWCWFTALSNTVHPLSIKITIIYWRMSFGLTRGVDMLQPTNKRRLHLIQARDGAQSPLSLREQRNDIDTYIDMNTTMIRAFICKGLWARGLCEHVEHVEYHYTCRNIRSIAMSTYLCMSKITKTR